MALTITSSEARMTPDASSGTYEVKNLYEMLVDTASDLSLAPSDALPGSLAYTADGQNWWMLANDGDWKVYGTVPNDEQPV